MRELDELIATGNELARELYAHLQDSNHPLMTHWDTLSEWHDAGATYVKENSPHSCDRVKPLNERDNETKIYGSIDSLLRVLRTIRATGHDESARAARLSTQFAPESASQRLRGLRGLVDILVTLLRDPIWQGISVLVAIGIAILGFVWAT